MKEKRSAVFLVLVLCAASFGVSLPARATPPQCRDGVDNDGDSLTDYPDDLGCDSKLDNTEDPDAPCAFNGTNCNGMVLHKDRRWLIGAVGDRPGYCMDDRPILVKKQRKGRDTMEAYEQADRNGEFRVEIKVRWKGKFYAVAPKWNVPQWNVSCDRKISNVVQVT